MLQSPVLVIGVQRSGTTWFGTLLARHHDVYLTVNGKLLYYLISWVYRNPVSASDKHLRLDEIAYSLGRKPILGIQPKDVQRMIEMLTTMFDPRRFQSMERHEIVATIWLEIYTALGVGKQVLGDKYNEYLLQLPEIRAIFPHARYIFLYRDPLDVAESMLRAFRGRPWAPSTPELALVRWSEWNREWLRMRPAIHSDRRLEICYETLVKQPEHTLATVCEFLGVRCAADFLDMVRALTRQEHMGLGSNLDVDWEQVRCLAPDFTQVRTALGY